MLMEQQGIVRHLFSVRCLFAALLLQHPSQSQQDTSWMRRMMSAFCEVPRGVGDREHPVQRYSEVFGLGAKGQGFVVEVDFQLTFSFLVVELEDCQHRFCSAELQLPGLEVFTYGRHVFAEHNFHCLSPSECMIARSSANAHFLETVFGKSGIDVEKKRC